MLGLLLGSLALAARGAPAQPHTRLVRSHISLSSSPESPEAPRYGNAQILGAFPFPLTELLLPGETKELHLFEERMTSLLEHSLKTGSLVAQMAFTDSGSALAVCSLLSVEFILQRDVGLNVVVRSVGRLRIVTINSAEPFISALFTGVDDEPLTTAAQRSYLKKQLVELLVLHDSCRLLRERLLRACLEEGKPLVVELGDDGDDEDVDVNGTVTWGHQLTRPDSGFAKPFEAQLAEALEAFEAARKKCEALPVTLLGKVHPEDLEFSVATMLACACFPTTTRLAAFAELDSAQRMDTVLALLAEQQKVLRAKLALVVVFGSSSSS
ncbi:hypothetical protein T492DRAFT_1107406 [Pavlovales sp. CCMP2436]|nr:hypothetical protein T492DRAFT_1107406 [Pavlovales sp. CCMP2436]